MLQKPTTTEIDPESDKTLVFLKLILFAVVLAMVFIGGMAAYYVFFGS